MKIKSWHDVDLALAEIAKRQAAIAAAKAAIDGERELIAAIEPRIEAWVREHEDEMQERSRALPHGRVWLHQAKRLSARSWARVLDCLVERKAWAYIRTKREVNKKALAGCTDEQLAGLGVRRKTEDVFGYEATP